jgi:TonB family protein
VLADTASISPASGGSPSGTMVGLEGIQRKLIRKRNPEFPTVLSAIGQEIEGEARIAVAPSGIVTRVEITRSSGYIEIDASVEAALRDYLFSRVDGRIDTVGTVHFRFRLEKQD